MMIKKYSIPITIAILLVIGYLVADRLLFNGVKSVSISENNFQADYFAKETTENKAAVILIGGGQWGVYWGQEFAKNEMVGLSLPYTGKDGLPKLPEDIDLKYFENAIKWLGTQKAVNPNKIVIMGASRNAELALVIASTFPEIVSGVIAYAPSSVSWANTVLPYNSNELKASWTYNGVDIPYIPMEKISGTDSGKINMLAYWENGLSKKDLVNNAAIKVEKIKGPILLLSGLNDKVWPSAKMADMIEKRLEDFNFKYDYKNMKYENAGHLISGNPDQSSGIRTKNITIDGKDYEYESGGTDNGDFMAKKDAYKQVFNFLSNLKNN